MPKHLRTAPPRRLALALHAIKLVTATALLGLVTTAWTSEHAAVPAHDLGVAEAPPSVVERVLRDHRCSSTGFGADHQPEGAVVRSPGGRLRTVTFDEGWAVFTGSRPGTLVAVCLDPPAASGDGLR